MGDSYWRYADGRQQASLPPVVGKRPRSDYDLSGSHELSSYFSRDDDRGAHRGVRDSDTIGASYDRYLRNSQISSYGVDPARPVSSGLGGRMADDPRIMGIGGPEPAVSAKGRSMGLSGGRSEILLPPDASSTLFVEGLPANCSRREVAHIFRPFVGYKEVRLVTKDSRHSGGEPLVLCFVDFLSPAHAATAMDALHEHYNDVLYRWFHSNETGSFHMIKTFQLSRMAGEACGCWELRRAMRTTKMPAAKGDGHKIVSQRQLAQRDILSRHWRSCEESCLE